MRDLVVGMTVVLSDGTIAKSGGKVIKNVAGYDLAKLFTGSYGTLGLIASVAVRLHPAPARTATLTGSSDDPERLARAAIALAGLPLEAECLDAGWEGEAGWLSLRFGGTTAAEQAEVARGRLDLDGVAIEAEDDADIWALRRALQRGELVVKVSGRPTDLPAVIREARDAGGTVVSRAALGLSWVNLPAGADVDAPPRGARPARLHRARRRRPRGRPVAGRRPRRPGRHGADQGALRSGSCVQAGHIRGRTVR